MGKRFLGGIFLYELIVNPVAGHGRALKIAQMAESYLAHERIPYRRQDTTHSGHATSLAAQAASLPSRRVVVIGGDGTLLEAARGLIHTGTPMLPLPGGTGNDFVKSLPFPKQPLDILKSALRGPAHQVDVGSVGSHIFLNVAGFGFDTDVLMKTQTYKTRFRGMLPYLLGTYSAIVHSQNRPLTYAFSNTRRETRALLAVIANGKYIGGGMHAAPLARVDDGLFDIVVASGVSKFNLFRLLPRFVRGKHLSLSFIKHHQTNQITLSPHTLPYHIDLDGEVFAFDEPSLTFSVLPGALSILFPE